MRKVKYNNLGIEYRPIWIPISIAILLSIIIFGRFLPNWIAYILLLISGVVIVIPTLMGIDVALTGYYFDDDCIVINPYNPLLRQRLKLGDLQYICIAPDRLNWKVKKPEVWMCITSEPMAYPVVKSMPENIEARVNKEVVYAINVSDNKELKHIEKYFLGKFYINKKFYEENKTLVDTILYNNNILWDQVVLA